MTPEVKQSSLKERADLAVLCNVLSLREAVEVGTDCGVFAHDFLQRWHGNTLYCIDPYLPYPEMNYDRTPDMMMAATRLSQFGWRCKIIRARSPQVIDMLPPKRQIDFVYIDGDHDYRSVRCDLEAWFKRLSPDGVLAGHDYCDEHDSVRRAVNEFAVKQEKSIFLVDDPVFATSWYIGKGHL